MTDWIDALMVAVPAPDRVIVRLRRPVELVRDARGLAVAANNIRLRVDGSLDGLADHVVRLGDGMTLAQLRAFIDTAATVGVTKPALDLIEAVAQRGLLEYVVAGGPLGSLTVVAHTRNYRPAIAQVAPDVPLGLSRFALMRRLGRAMILESPLSDALVTLTGPAAKLLADLTTPAPPSKLWGGSLREAMTALGMLVAAGYLLPGPVVAEEIDPALATWDFHDLLFHARSRSGRHSFPSGGHYLHAGEIAPAPVARGPSSEVNIPLARSGELGTDSFLDIIEQRVSTRDFDSAHPIDLTELGRFLYHCARIRSVAPVEATASGTRFEISSRPYPSGGASYEFEIYPCVFACNGLPPGFYHYDARAHALSSISRSEPLMARMAGNINASLGVRTSPQVVLLVTARFARVSWKYSSIAHATTLKNLGALIQTMYLTAEAMHLGGCALGNGDIEQFQEITGVPFYDEGLIGEFLLGRRGDMKR
jgi:SagB-type dehydrogenase family enzyme